MSIRSVDRTNNESLHHIDSILVNSNEYRISVLTGKGVGQVSQFLGQSYHLGLRWTIVLSSEGLVVVDVVSGATA